MFRAFSTQAGVRSVRIRLNRNLLGRVSVGTKMLLSHFVYCAQRIIVCTMNGGRDDSKLMSYPKVNLFAFNLSYIIRGTPSSDWNGYMFYIYVLLWGPGPVAHIICCATFCDMAR